MQSCCTQNPQTPPVQNSKSCKVPRGAELAWFPSSLQCFRIQQGRSSGSQKLPRAGGVGGEGPGTWWGLDQKDRGGGGGGCCGVGTLCPQRLTLRPAELRPLRR